MLLRCAPVAHSWRFRSEFFGGKTPACEFSVPRTWEDASYKLAENVFEFLGNYLLVALACICCVLCVPKGTFRRGYATPAVACFLHRETARARFAARAALLAPCFTVAPAERAHRGVGLAGISTRLR